MKRFDTILAGNNDEQLTANTSHPMFYYRARNGALENIAERIETNNRMGEVDLRRNVHVDYLTRVYEKKKRQLHALQNEKNRCLPPENFKSIFDSGPSKEELEDIERRRGQKQRQKMFEDFILNYQVEQPVEKPERPQVEILSVHHQLKPLSEADQRIVRQREQDLKLLNGEISRLRANIEADRQQASRKEQCSNLAIIQRMSNSIISSYMVHFDEIFSLLIDDILEEEVEYLNNLERGGVQPHRQTREGQHRTIPPEHRKLVEVLRQLDELCSDD